MKTPQKYRLVSRIALVSVASVAFFSMTSTVNAAAIITSVEFQSPSGGSALDSFSIDNINKTIDLSKTFAEMEPVVLRFTVGHEAGGGNQYEVTESITNNTGIEWADYHFAIESTSPSGIVFNNFQSSFVDGFTLDDPPDSGPRNLNFTGTLIDGGNTQAGFLMSLADPGNGNSYTFDLVQTPTTAGSPPAVIPLPPAAFLLGSAVMGMVGAVRKRRAQV
jgi:hypothetical protein